jgi:hypothetical protein
MARQDDPRPQPLRQFIAFICVTEFAYLTDLSATTL